MNYDMNMKKSFVAVAIASYIAFSCEKTEQISTAESQPEPVTQAEPEIPEKPARTATTVQDSMVAEQQKMTFENLIFPKDKRDSAMGAFTENFTEEQRYKILALNRLDNKNKWRADTLVVPKNLEASMMSFSPFPLEVDSLKNVEKLAMFSYNIHAYALYENGKLIKWGPSSMGKKATPTKKGLMFTNWKKEEAISTSNSEWILRWNFNIHNTLGIGWHQYDLPGHHASHSCLRLLEDDAKFMYSWADQWVLTDGGNTVKAKGTPVIVFGETDFKERPWLKLAENAIANNYSVEEINNLVEEYLPQILEEQKNSDSVRDEKKQLITKEENITVSDKTEKKKSG